MRPPRIVFILGGVVGLLTLATLVVLPLVDVHRLKPRLEAAASEALGMDVRIEGRLGVSVFPGVHVTVEDGQILTDQGAVIAAAKKVTVGIQWLPLFRREVRLRRVELTEPTLSIERDAQGKLNVERLNEKAATLLGALNGASVSVSQGKLIYTDLRSGGRFEAIDFDLAVHRIRLPGTSTPQRLQDLSFQGELECRELRTKNLAVSALKVSVDAKNGSFDFRPITMKLFGGSAAGSLLVDFSGPVPLYRVHYSLPRFRIEEFLQVLSPKQTVAGVMDFSTTLWMQGKTADQLVRTTTGGVSLLGDHLVLTGSDLDREFSRFESSQSFNLVDVGAVLFAGPLGLAVTKGYNFTSLFHGSGGNSHIGTLVSRWRVERGVAQAKDVAMATARNRIALRGRLDFVRGRFEDVTVAVIDASGCIRLRQAIRGSFDHPMLEKPRVLASLSAPMRRLYGKARNLFPSGPCEVFYAGSVAPPSRK